MTTTESSVTTDSVTTDTQAQYIAREGATVQLVGVT
ncbi:MAG: hypothetical protein QOH44_647, partial [Actinomycetota bacterium]|nr:hypothetical protein [Actinomycetota bacterium]